MQTKAVQIENITTTDLLNEVGKMLDSRFTKLAPPPPTDPDQYITRQQVAQMFSITLPTVHSWINAKILKPYKIGNKTRFILSEVKASAKANK